MKKRIWNIRLMSAIACIVFMTALFSINACAKTPTPTVNALVICSRNTFHEAKDVSKDIYNVLLRNKYPGYKNNTFKYFYNADQSAAKKGATYKDIDRQLDKAFSDSKKNDINILFYCGHTIFMSGRKKAQDDKYGLALSNANKKGKEDFYGYKALAKKLSKYKGKMLVIMDTCFADSFYKEGVMSLGRGLQSKFTCMASNVITDETQGAKYTKGLVAGSGYSSSYKKQPSDSNKDGVITVDEAHSYAVQFAQKKAKNKRVQLHDNAGLSSFPLFQQSYLSVKKANIEISISDNPQTIKKLFLIERNPSSTERKVIWKSSNDNVVRVNNCYSQSSNKYNLVVETKKTGTVTLTGTLVWDGIGRDKECIGSKQIKIKAKVTKPSLTLDKKKLTLPAGASYKLNATLKNSTEKIKWKTDCPELVSVDKNGNVKIKDAADLRITRSYNDGSYIYSESLNVSHTGPVEVTAYTESMSVTCAIDIFPFEGGKGTKKDPYLIKTPYQFKRINSYGHSTYDGETYHNYYKQIADLNFKNSEIQPVYDAGNTAYDGKFDSVYDGNKHKISNLTIEPHTFRDNYGRTNAYTQFGLFYCIGPEGVVKNLILDNISINAHGYIPGYNDYKSYKVGFVTGYSYGHIENCTIQNCKVLNSGRLYSEIGGIVGRMVTQKTSAIKNCNVSNILISNVGDESEIGGIIGSVITGYNEKGVISNCKVNGMKLQNTGKESNTAGIAGTAGDLSISNCNISGANDFTYAFCGKVYSGMISNCTVKGTKKGGSQFTKEDLFGSVWKNATVTNCIVVK